MLIFFFTFVSENAVSLQYKIVNVKSCYSDEISKSSLKQFNDKIKFII